MSGPIQSWKDKVAEALTFAKPLHKDYKTVFSFNVRNITHLEFSDRNTFISLIVHLVGLSRRFGLILALIRIHCVQSHLYYVGGLRKLTSLVMVK